MSIFARRLTVENYRNFASFELELDEHLTMLVGRNAVGKTNLVEALQLLTAGRSFRRPSPAEMVLEGRNRCALKLDLEGEGRVIDHGCRVEEGRRSFSRNGKRCPASGMRGVVPSVLFCPDDLDMVKRGARVRRDAIDGFGVQLNESYAQLEGTYERAVEQRNALLKEAYAARELMGAWNESLAATGAALTVHRLALLDRARRYVRTFYASLAGGEQADISYVPTWECGGEDVIAAVASGEHERAQAIEAVRARLEEAYEARAEEELRRGVTLVGPHRDEIVFTIAGRDARAFASQGQQRSLVLAWKMAEVAVTRDILSHPPLLLLDDVMSELDAARRAAFITQIEEGVQTVITTTNLGYFDTETLERAKVVTIGEGEHALG